jgi:hypothetical protein
VIVIVQGELALLLVVAFISCSSAVSYPLMAYMDNKAADREHVFRFKHPNHPGNKK